MYLDESDARRIRSIFLSIGWADLALPATEAMNAQG